MTATPTGDWQDLLSHGGCSCSVCTGQGLNQIFAGTATTTTTGTGTLATTSPLSSIPLLSSNSGATAKLFLDFNGHTQASWGSYTNVITPVYDQDGDRTTFSAGELNSIQEIWARVAEDYAAFNIDVTTIDPGSSADRVVARVAIGGNYSDWFGHSAGGVAYIGGFYNGAPNVGYVFEDALGNGAPRFVAEAASHEAGHLFGLYHQSEWNGNTLVSSYSQGNAAWAPIMGVGYYSQRTTWHNGATDSSPTAYQDDMAILANASNGFGYRADDFGSTLAQASALASNAGSVNFAGRIGSNTDQDWFSFTTTGGALNLTLNVAQFGANLDSVLELRDATGTLLVTANPTNSLSATLTSTLASGTYFVVVRSTGGYGNVGQYTLAGSVPVSGSVGGGGGSGGEDTSGPQPEINVLNGTVAVQSGGTISFGSLQVGKFVNKVITVKNTGPGVLNLESLVGTLPPGFTLVSNFGSLTLASNQSTSFTIRFAPTTAGAVSQTLNIGSNDADESAFSLQLVGTATPAPQPEINVAIGTTAVQTGGTINFGSLQVGQYVNKTITIKNTGPASLTLQKLVAAEMPPGFTIVTNLAKTVLAKNQSTTFTVRFTPSAVGSVSESITLFSNDADESSFVINLNGTATPAPVIRAIDNGATGFTSTGTWTRSTTVGREKDIQTALKGTGTTTATWTFTNMPPGIYRVHASWTQSSAYATNAPFTIFDGATELSTVRVNQERASSGLTWGGTAWSNLGTFTITGDTVRVTLTNAANDRVLADAVRIERIGDLPEAEGAAAAASELHGLPVVDSSATTSFHSSFESTANNFFWAPTSFFGSGATVMAGQSQLTPNSVDEVFAATADARPELQLLESALDLLRVSNSPSSSKLTSSSSNSSSSLNVESPSFETLPTNWLLDDRLDALLN
ncbi:choice-of-anchor D domain-containing protein [Anatilimnocola aggregata]|nr:choice-of-anchor D domain-containing protein [Anatilimnocola aggregata]